MSRGIGGDGEETFIHGKVEKGRSGGTEQQRDDGGLRQNRMMAVYGRRNSQTAGCDDKTRYKNVDADGDVDDEDDDGGRREERSQAFYVGKTPTFIYFFPFLAKMMAHVTRFGGSAS